MSSFVSAKGPSVTVVLPPANVMRAPLADACRPSPASMTPSFTSCSLKLPISVNCSAVGSTPDSISSVDRTRTANRMVFLLGIGVLCRRRTGSAEIDTRYLKHAFQVCYGTGMSRTPDMRRRADVLERIVDYVYEHGVSQLSLRPLGEAIGCSPRLLLYFFSSKEDLVTAVLAAAGARQRALVSRLQVE